MGVQQFAAPFLARLKSLLCVKLGSFGPWGVRGVQADFADSCQHQFGEK